MEEITGSITIGKLKKIPELQDCSEYLLILDTMSLEELDAMTVSEISGLQTENILEGIRRLCQLKQEGKKVVYDYWSDQEKEEIPGKKRTKLFFMPGEEGKPFVLICAGGAYMGVCSLGEGFSTASRLNQMGYNAFVLSYRVTESPLFPKPLEDAAAALRFIFAHKGDFQVSTDNYAVCGFSAGGHLAAEWGTEQYGYKAYGLPRPGALFLMYPAVSLYTFLPTDHIGRMYITTLIGENWTPELMEKASAEKNVTSAYPPVYMLQCKDDPTVPVASSELLAEALEKNGIQYLYRLIEKGGHGIGLADFTEAAGWLDEAVKFWQMREKNQI